jgi:hypothetical protein
MNATVKTGYDVYCPKPHPTLRIAVAAGARLPARFKAVDWKPMARGTSPLHYDVSRDIGAEGYCYFQGLLLLSSRVRRLNRGGPLASKSPMRNTALGKGPWESFRIVGVEQCLT